MMERAGLIFIFFAFTRVFKKKPCLFWTVEDGFPGLLGEEEHAEEGRQEEEEDCGASRTVLDLDAPTWLI